MKRFFSQIGPGTLVAAAFIGPGTVTVCTLAGVEFGFTMLWAMVLSVIATIVLQEMAARLGLVTGKGLAQVLRDEINSPAFKFIALALVVSAILVGNAAYEAGNISGGALGLQTLIPNSQVDIGSIRLNTLSITIGLLAFVFLFVGRYKLIERSLVVLVIFMSLSFLLAAFLTEPAWIEVLKGLFVPSVPKEGLLTVIALVGTTVVPYNLFLHASLVKEKWRDERDLKAARRDTYVSITLGGLVSLAIIICGAGIQQSGISSAAGLAAGLKPLYGELAKWVVSLGLFAAGITSAITAPLAAAYVAKGCFGWQGGLKSNTFRLIWMLVLLMGVIFSSIGWSPIEIIRFAQVANGLLLPIIAIFLLWAVNQRKILDSYVNKPVVNLLGVLIILATLILSIRSLERVFELNLLG
ncbi:Nramp family divalent metal transporter [Aureitalea marina]|uniref:Manganese transporter n=1 Tax=Aureitalea marina TaxID=930804 RepID=A0A2S7KTK6_9FLAO|nr:Nramp family divalent metal transporter [Aureitalea marina]PQB05950.1 manganese transporter [Aureitalea marina]